MRAGEVISGAQFLLDVQQQLALWPTVPVLEPLALAADTANGCQSAGVLAAVADAGQLPLPLPGLPLPLEDFHVPHDGKAPCLRGWRYSTCPHHPEELKPKAETCTLQRCSSSAETNGLERARDLWDGTADDPSARVGLRHFGAVPLGVFVWTLPEQLRAQVKGSKLRDVQREADLMTAEVLGQQVMDEDARWYLHSFVHPVGEPRLPPADPRAEVEELQLQEGPYHPHVNVLVPLAGLSSSGRRVRPRHLLPREWLGEGGWVQARWRERLESLFGRWWCSSIGEALEARPPPVLNWQYGFRVTPEEKMHAAKYFARVFPRWARRPDVPLRPRASALKHHRGHAELQQLLVQLAVQPLPRFASCARCAAAGEDVPKVSAAGSDEEMARAGFERALQLHQLECERCAAAGAPYVQHRRIISGGPPLETGPPDATGPPAPASWTADDERERRALLREVTRAAEPGSLG